MDRLVASFRHCLGNLFEFSGRDRPGQYWPYVLTLFGIKIMVNMAMTVPMMLSGFRQAMVSVRNAAAGQAGDPQVLQSEMMRSMMADAQEMLPLGLAVTALFALLVLAATVRRLHDRNWPGWWVLLAAASLAIGIAGDQWLMALLAQNPDALVDNMAQVQAIGWAPWIGYVILIVQLVQSGTPGDNRFGPPPE